MGLIRIREYNDYGRGKDGRGGASGIVRGMLVTDSKGLPIKTVTTIAGTAVDSAKLDAKTHVVAIEAVDCTVRYAIRPKNLRWTPLPATEAHNPLPAGGVAFEDVYPGCVISFLQTSEAGGALLPFQQYYVPVLAL